MMNDFDNSQNNSASDSDELDANDGQLIDFVKRQKVQIKELQEKLESSKKQYKEDKADIE